MTTPTSPNLPEPATCEDCLTAVAYLRATKDSIPVWGEDCVCQNPVYPSDPDGSDAGSISLPLVRLSDAQLLAAEVERLRAAINDHNTDCVAQCAARKDAGPSHCPMKGYRRNCSDCPRDGMLDIDASRLALKEETK